MKFPTQIEYLRNSGVFESGNTDDLIAAKKQYRKEYLKFKKREFREKHQSVTLSFPKAEIKKIKKDADLHQMKLHQYLKACIQVAREQAYIVPNVDEVQQLEILLKRIGTHTNQVARLANQMSIPPNEALAELRNHLQYFEETFDTMFREPKNLNNHILGELQKNPAFLKSLFHIIVTFIELNVHTHPKTRK